MAAFRRHVFRALCALRDRPECFALHLCTFGRLAALPGYCERPTDAVSPAPVALPSAAPKTQIETATTSSRFRVFFFAITLL